MGSSDLPGSHRPVAAIGNCSQALSRPRDHRSPLQNLAERVTPPPLFGLAPCGVCPALDIAAEAVRSCFNPAEAGRTFSPLPRLNGAVYFLWHFPCRKRTPRLPGDPLPALAVNERTTLWSSDFPPPCSCLPFQALAGPSQTHERGGDRPACPRYFYVNLPVVKGQSTARNAPIPRCQLVGARRNKHAKRMVGRILFRDRA
jgi:hypothetical protein